MNMMTHPALMLELTRAATATRMHDAEQFRLGRCVEAEIGSMVASRAAAQGPVRTREQVAARRCCTMAWGSATSIAATPNNGISRRSFGQLGCR
jgi:hypothetical protein